MIPDFRAASRRMAIAAPQLISKLKYLVSILKSSWGEKKFLDRQ